MRKPIGYLRKSKVTSDRHVSWEVQEREVRALAARHGDDDIELMADWSKSGRGAKTHLRTEYGRMRKMIEDGEVSALYSYSLSRLGRSLPELSSLIELCVEQGVAVRLVVDAVDTSTASGRLLTNVLASVAQFEAEVGQERARDTIATRRSRGDHVGSAGFGHRLVNGRKVAEAKDDIAAVLAAFREAGSFAGAAKLLNARKVPAKHDGAKWAGTSVARVLRREAKGEVPKPDPERARVRMRGSFTLSRLLICPCGNVMTGRSSKQTTKYGEYGPYVSYQCFRGRYEPDHVRPYMVTEKAILPLIQETIEAKLRMPKMTRAEVDTSAERADLEAQRERLALEFVRSGLGEDAVRAESERIDKELARLDKITRVTRIPTIDWSWSPRDLNVVLTELLDGIKLGRDLRPVKYLWGIPEWIAG